MPKVEQTFIANSLKSHPYKDSPKLPRLTRKILFVPPKAAGSPFASQQSPSHISFLSNTTVHCLLGDLYCSRPEQDRRAKELPIANENDSLCSAIELLASNRISTVPVQNTKGDLIGLLDISDLVSQGADIFLKDGGDSIPDYDTLSFACTEQFSNTTIGDILMTSSKTPQVSPLEWKNEFHAVRSTASVLDLLCLMSQPNIHRIAVVERKAVLNQDGFFSNSSTSINLKDITDCFEKVTDLSKMPASQQVANICNCESHKSVKIGGFSNPNISNTSVVGVLTCTEIARFLSKHMGFLNTILSSKVPVTPVDSQKNPLDKKHLLSNAFKHIWKKQLSGTAHCHGVDNVDKFFLWIVQILIADLKDFDAFTVPKDTTLETALEMIANLQCDCLYVMEGEDSKKSVIGTIPACDVIDLVTNTK